MEESTVKTVLDGENVRLEYGNGMWMQLNAKDAWTLGMGLLSMSAKADGRKGKLAVMILDE